MEKTLYKSRIVISDRMLGTVGIFLALLYLISEMIILTPALWEKLAPSTVAVIFRTLGACSVPLLFYLSVKWLCTFRGMLIAVITAASAALSLLPYADKLRSLCISAVMIFLLRRYGEKHIISACIIISAVIWALILNSDGGLLSVSLSAALFSFRKSPALTAVASSAVLTAYSVYNVFFMISPLCCILFFYCKSSNNT